MRLINAKIQKAINLHRYVCCGATDWGTNGFYGGEAVAKIINWILCVSGSARLVGLFSSLFGFVTKIAKPVTFKARLARLVAFVRPEKNREKHDATSFRKIHSDENRFGGDRLVGRAHGVRKM